jgi:hypothetical protein
MRPGENADRVELDGAQPLQHPGDSATTSLGPEEPLRAQRYPAHVVCGEG